MTLEHKWPDCKEVQCERGHEALRTVMQLLNIECDDSIYVVGKTIHIAQEIGRLKVLLAESRTEAFENKTIGNAYKAVIDSALDDFQKIPGFENYHNAGLNQFIEHAAQLIRQRKDDK